jgi:hypothetical protein
VTILDLVWPMFVLAGIEQVRIVPATRLHYSTRIRGFSLAMSIVWGVLAAVARAAVGACRSYCSSSATGCWLSATRPTLWPGESPKFEWQ